jgi:hypothetical protein
MCTSVSSHDNRPFKSQPEKNRKAKNSWSKSAERPLIEMEGEKGLNDGHFNHESGRRLLLAKSFGAWLAEVAQNLAE